MSTLSLWLQVLGAATPVTTLGAVLLTQWHERRRDKDRWTAEFHARVRTDRQELYGKFLAVGAKAVKHDAPPDTIDEFIGLDECVQLLADHATSQAAYDFAHVIYVHWQQKHEERTYPPAGLPQARAAFYSAARQNLGLGSLAQKIAGYG
jgi:hypothetical protein